MASVDVLERLSVFTPLGIRFWDLLLSDQIRSGLQVTAWPMASGRRQQAVTAFRTRSDIYAFQGLPGLRALQYPAPAGTDPGLGSPEMRRFAVEIVDLEQRFVPVAQTIDLPLPHRGLFPLEPGSPSRSAMQRFFLFSSASRSVLPGIAAIRGELAVRGEPDPRTGEPTEQPAAHAMVRVQIIGGANATGLADDAGRFAVLLPYRPLPASGLGSPAGASGTSLRDAVWPFALSVHHDPPSLQPVPGTALPNYRSVLRQAAAPVWSVAPVIGALPDAEWFGELRFGEEVVVRTAGSSRLLVGADWSAP